MNPLTEIERVAKERHPDLYTVVGDYHDFNRAVSQDLELQYPCLFIMKSIQPQGNINSNRFTESVPLQLFFMLHPDRTLDETVPDQMGKVETMAKKARKFLYNFLHDNSVKKEIARMPTRYDLDTIYYNQNFTLFGVRLRFTLEYYPDYTEC